MKKAYSLTGIDCANCAQQLEDELRKLPVVKKVSYHFPTKRLAVSYSDDPTAEAQLKELIAKREPEAVLKPYGTASAPQNNSRLYLLIAALVLFLIGFFLRLKFGSFNIFSTLFPATEEALESGLAHGASKAGGVEVLPGSFGFTMQITSLLAFALSYILAAKRVYRKAFRNLKMGRLLDENLLMIIASLGAILLGEYPEAVAVMLFFAWGEYLEDRAVDASRRSIEETMNIMPEEASLLKDGQAITVKPEELVVGDIILIRPGAKVPADGVVVEGHSQLDSKAITGESLPLEVGPGDNVLSGCVNQSALLSLKVTKAYEDSTVARMLQLIADAAEKRSPTERFITRFARYYTPAVVGIAALLAVIPPLLDFGSFSTWLYRALIFLVASCPCALVISVPLAYFAGLGAASRQGILVKGGNALEELAKAHTLILDKTGTLTEGNFAISGLETADGVSETELLEAAIIGEAGSQHPLAVALRQSVQRLCLSGGCKLCAIEEEKQHPASTAAEQDCCADSHAHGDGCCADGHTHEHAHDDSCCAGGHTHEHAHGDSCCADGHTHEQGEDCCAPSASPSYLETLANLPTAGFRKVLHKLNLKKLQSTEHKGLGVEAEYEGSKYFCGNAKLMREAKIAADLPDAAATSIYVAKDGKYLGVIYLADIIKANAASTVQALTHCDACKIRSVVMLTGDKSEVAADVCAAVGISRFAADLLPEDKLEAYERIDPSEGTRVFIGDGINDAPVLMASDVGVAMGGIGQAAAIEAADIIIANDNLEKFHQVLHISKKTRSVVRQNIVFALSIKFLVLVLGALGYASMWSAVFADVGVALIAVFNSLRILKSPV